MEVSYVLCSCVFCRKTHKFSVDGQDDNNKQTFEDSLEDNDKYFTCKTNGIGDHKWGLNPTFQLRIQYLHSF